MLIVGHELGLRVSLSLSLEVFAQSSKPGL